MPENLLNVNKLVPGARTYGLMAACGIYFDGTRGESYTPLYSASKAFMSNYLEGIRHRMTQEKRAMHVTDIRPGWVDTDMAKGEETFWMVSAKEAALDIYSAIAKKRTQAYITARWRLYAWLVRCAPKWFYDRFF